MTLIPLILSGGAGTRLWPLSCGEGHRFMVAQQIGEVLSKSQQSFWNNRIFRF